MLCLSLCIFTVFYTAIRNILRLILVLKSYENVTENKLQRLDVYYKMTINFCVDRMLIQVMVV